jgi:preprotein translocase subunit SecE
VVAANPANWVRDARQYIAEVRNEYRKVTWPSQTEYVGGTVGVVVVVVVLTLVLGVVDFTLSQLLQLALP